MAKSDDLYDNPRSPKTKGQQEAKKGDVKKGKDLSDHDENPENDDAEYESVGTPQVNKPASGEEIDEEDRKPWAKEVLDQKDKSRRQYRLDSKELYKRRSIPTS